VSKAVTFGGASFLALALAASPVHAAASSGGVLGWVEDSRGMPVPGALISLLGRLEKNQNTGNGGFYATHPAAKDRIAKLQPEEKKLGGEKKVPQVRVDRFMQETAEVRGGGGGDTDEGNDDHEDGDDGYDE
jgi:hypothetical protein